VVETLKAIITNVFFLFFLGGGRKGPAGPRSWNWNDEAYTGSNGA
jgi:hypothetical protein